MPNTSVNLSTASIPGPSTPIAINWRGGRPVFWSVTTNSSVATGDFTLQFTSDDIQLTANTSIYPPVGSPTLGTSVAYWTALSSANNNVVSVGSGIHFTSSTIWPDGIYGTFPAPPAALRIFSSAGSSNILTLTVLQGDGG